MTTEENKESTPPKRRRTRRKVDVHGLRAKLLSTCASYLDQTPLDQLNGSMLKSIAEVISGAVAADFLKEEGRTQRNTLKDFALPFPAPGDLAHVEPDAPKHGMVPDGVTPGFPSVPIPTVRSQGGIKPLPIPMPFDVDSDDYSGLQKPA